MPGLTRRELLAGAAIAPAAAAAAKKPNVLLIMTDQHRADAIGAYGNHVIRTPNLDRLAEGGTRFNSCWSQHPVCMPSRASIFTGRYPNAHRVRTNGVRLPEYEVTLAKHFRANGYRTFGAGKFHFIPHFMGNLPLMENHPEPYYGFEEFHIGEDARRGEQKVWLEREHPEFAGKPDYMLPHDLHTTGWVANHTIDCLRRAASAGQPFFAFASFVDPHHPYGPPSPYREMYKEKDMPAPMVRPGELEDKPAFIREIAESQRKTYQRVGYHRTQYYGEVTFIDDAVGRILKTLEELKLRENTLIVFTADHGDLLGDHYMFYKGPYHFRQCANVPLIVNWPGVVRGGQVVDGIVQEIDLFPTMMDFAGLSNPLGIQGRSQRAVLTGGGSGTGYDSALIEHGISGAALPAAGKLGKQPPDVWTLVTPEWRISYSPGAEIGQLYDHSSDPNEFVNRWKDPKLADVRARLTRQLLDRILEAHDPLPVRELPY